MSLLLRSSRVLQRVSSINPAVSFASHAPVAHKEESPIGNREVVGFGSNGKYIYTDRPDYPMPAIRFKSPTPDILAIRAKEKGDWKKLTLEEKKQLYRASFCQTFSEMEAPTGHWKSVFGCGLFFISLALWVFMGMKLFVYPKELPITFSEERRQAQMQRLIDIASNPIEGLASKWDYEKNDWKK